MSTLWEYRYSDCVLQVRVRRPECIICGDEIDSEYCYVLDDGEKMDSCICEDCERAEFEKIRANNDEAITEAFGDWMIDRLSTTPTCEEEVVHSYFGREDE